MLYFKEEDYSKTISYLGQALKLQSVFAGKLDLDMTCYLAESHYQLKEYDEAEKIYDKLINNDSKNAQYYILKGECLAKSGDAKAAVKVYEQGWNRFHVIILAMNKHVIHKQIVIKNRCLASIFL